MSEILGCLSDTPGVGRGWPPLRELSRAVGPLPLLYNSVRKPSEQFVALVDEHGRDGVLTWGTRSGADLDGEPFEGVRYADLFILNEDGQIAEQDVWNDLAAEWRLAALARIGLGPVAELGCLSDSGGRRGGL